MSRAKAEELGAPVLAEIGAHGVVAGPDPSLLSQPSQRDPQGPREGGEDPGRRGPVRDQRGVRRGRAAVDARPGHRPTRTSTSTAARSRWATPSARQGRGSRCTWRWNWAAAAAVWAPPGCAAAAARARPCSCASPADRCREPGLMNGAPMKVLVVEDEAAAARVLVEEVAGAPGFAVVGHTHSGAEALRRIVSDEGIDLILLDIQLPDISGMDVLRRLRAAGCDVDVMAVTVMRDPSTLQTAMALGVVHYLLKPFTAATVRQKLEHYRTFRAAPARRRRPPRRPAGDRRGLHRAAGDGRRPSPERRQPGVAARRGYEAAAVGGDVRRRRSPRSWARRGSPRGATWSTSPSPAWPNGAPATAGPAAPRSSTGGPATTSDRLRTSSARTVSGLL